MKWQEKIKSKWHKQDGIKMLGLCRKFFPARYFGIPAENLISGSGKIYFKSNGNPVKFSVIKTYSIFYLKYCLEFNIVEFTALIKINNCSMFLILNFF